MGIFDFFKKHVNSPEANPPHDTEINIQYGTSPLPKAEITTSNATRDYDQKIEYVRLSTSGDKTVCQMCTQFEGKIFPASDAPELPLCPSCACAYEYYFKEDLPTGVEINSKNNFILPAECTRMFYQKQQKAYEESDINKRILLCKSQLNKIHEFMAPYNSAGFEPPAELACRDLLPNLYMQLGKWKEAEKAIKTCIEANAYSPECGPKALVDFMAYRKVATETLSYISENPGCLQRNIYKVMGYDGEEKEMLKEFLRHSMLIEKTKLNNTNQLFCKGESCSEKEV